MHDGPGWKLLSLDEVESRPWPQTELSWHPIREDPDLARLLDDPS